MTYFIDSHTHITNEELDMKLYLGEIKEAKENGVGKAMLVFTNEKELNVIESIEDDTFFDMAYGIYPDDFKEVNEDDFKRLIDMHHKYHFKALGEIGLDYYWYKDNKEIQKEYFRRQLMIANELDLPVIIHARDAIQDTYDILKEVDVRRKGVLHCYSGSMEMAKEFIKLGYYISFSGTVTFKNNKRGVETALEIDKNYLLCETDAPYLTPVPNRGKPNKTAYVKYVYEFLSELLKMDIEDLKVLTQNNYQKLFKEEI